MLVAVMARRGLRVAVVAMEGVVVAVMAKRGLRVALVAMGGVLLVVMARDGEENFVGLQWLRGEACLSL